MTPMISIIIPVYNTAPYLRRCLDSVCAQLRQGVEIIIVNDGSTDDSAEIMNEYSAAFPQIRVITQDNRGLSAARNAGLSLALGEYVWFVDSDDEAEPRSIHTLQHLLQRYPGLDMLRFGHTQIGEDGRILRTVQHPAAGPLTSSDYFNRHEVMHEACMGWYRRAYLIGNGLSFAEGYVFEDTVFNMQAYSLGGSLLVIPEPLYRYHLRAGSLSRSGTSLRKVLSLTGLLKVCDTILEAHTEDPKAVAFVAAKKLDFVNLLADHLYLLTSYSFRYRLRIFRSICPRIPVFAADRRGVQLMKIFLRFTPALFFALRYAGLLTGRWKPHV